MGPGRGLLEVLRTIPLLLCEAFLAHAAALRPALRPKRVSVNYNDETCSDQDITVRLQIDSEWFNIRRGREVSLNKFITLQFSMITTLSIFKNCSSSQEWGELLRRVRIKAGMLFPKSLMIDYTSLCYAPDYSNPKNAVKDVKSRPKVEDAKSGAKPFKSLAEYSGVIHHIYTCAAHKPLGVLGNHTSDGSAHDYTNPKNAVKARPKGEGSTAVDHWIYSLRRCP